MRVSSVRVAVIVLMAALALTACDNGEPRAESLGLTHTPADLSEVEGTWVADSILDPDTSLVPGSEIEIRFEFVGKNLLVTLIGWHVAGWLGALVATAAIVIPSSVLFYGLTTAWHSGGPARRPQTGRRSARGPLHR